MKYLVRKGTLFWLFYKNYYQKNEFFTLFSILYNCTSPWQTQKSCTFAPMKIIRTSILPFRGFSAVNLLGILFVHHGVYLSNEMMNHERIHTAQQREMLFVFFYMAYFIEWLVRLPMRGNAYRNISFEREAYSNQRDLDYLKTRPCYAWRQYMRRPINHRKNHSR